MDAIEQEIQWLSLAHRFDHDPRVVAARRQYRADLKAGMAERDAWHKANAVYKAVRAEIGLPTMAYPSLSH